VLKVINIFNDHFDLNLLNLMAMVTVMV